MHRLLRPASAAVIILGLSAGAPSEAQADVAYDSFGSWFDAMVSGDHKDGDRGHKGKDGDRGHKGKGKGKDGDRGKNGNGNG